MPDELPPQPDEPNPEKALTVYQPPAPSPDAVVVTPVSVRKKVTKTRNLVCDCSGVAEIETNTGWICLECARIEAQNARFAKLYERPAGWRGLGAIHEYHVALSNKKSNR